jgi:beta-glucosidase
VLKKEEVLMSEDQSIREMSGFMFPDRFLWGTATSAHQVEGGQVNNDWWATEHIGGYVYQDQTAGDACGWWESAQEDFDRMKNLNTNTHRLSIEWSRVQPQPGTWSESALQRYREIILELKDRGITPMVTLHHFTNPLWMAVLGGWENENSPDWFEAYVRKVVESLGDLVDLWCTINEPMVLLSQGYLLGSWPPHNRSVIALYQAGLNLIKGHGAAYHVIHKLNPNAQVGIAKHMVVWRPFRGWMPSDHLAARTINRLSNSLLLDALIYGELKIPFRKRVPLQNVAGTLDWIGINYYQRFRVGLKLRNIAGKIIPRLPAEIFYHGTSPDYQKGPGPWGEIHAEGLYDTLQSVRNYGLPIYITENGIPDRDDNHRPRFIITHLHQLWKAIQDGIDVQGYFYWSLVDNFEWSEGYNPDFRFGLFGVDFETQKRTLRTSGRLFAKICQVGGITREMVDEYDPSLSRQLFG